LPRRRTSNPSAEGSDTLRFPTGREAYLVTHQLPVGAGAGLDSRGRAGSERDGLVRQPRAGRIPESGTLQQVAAHTRIAKHRKEVDIAFHSDLAIAFRRGLHFGGRVVAGQ